jgi:hypothetical protein
MVRGGGVRERARGVLGRERYEHAASAHEQRIGDGSALSIFPSKIYSGVDGQTTFKAPVVAVGGKNVRWSLSDPSIATLEPSADGTQLMITAKKAGKTTLTATVGSQRATATINVTQYTPQQLADGKKRYTTTGATGQACANCHGKGQNAPDHTPTQTPRCRTPSSRAWTPRASR